MLKMELADNRKMAGPKRRVMAVGRAEMLAMRVKIKTHNPLWRTLKETTGRVMIP